mgnify:CR=1 FL=1
MPQDSSKKSDKLIRIGTRASLLATTQTQEVKRNLIKSSGLNENQIEIVEITTSGDKFKNVSLADIGGKGLFIKELEEALITNKIDLAVHSAKDVPPQVRQGTQIATFTKRKDPNDYFISKKYKSIDDLPQKSVIGTSSARRKSILLGLRPDLKIINFRGNVDTRLNKIEEDKVDATILALCGLERLGKKIDKNKIIDIKTMLPSVGQGSLAIQIRNDDEDLRKIVRKINDRNSEICIHSERVFLDQLNASCKSPVSVYCHIKDDKLFFNAKIYDFDGKNEFLTHDILEIGELLKDFDKNYRKILDLSENIAISMANKVKKEAQGLLEKICG